LERSLLRALVGGGPGVNGEFQESKFITEMKSRPAQKPTIHAPAADRFHGPPPSAVAISNGT